MERITVIDTTLDITRRSDNPKIRDPPANSTLNSSDTPLAILKHQLESYLPYPGDVYCNPHGHVRNDPSRFIITYYPYANNVFIIVDKLVEQPKYWIPLEDVDYANAGWYITAHRANLFVLSQLLDEIVQPNILKEFHNQLNSPSFQHFDAQLAGMQWHVEQSSTREVLVIDLRPNSRLSKFDHPSYIVH
ncbi:hypothetical protein FRB99_003851 [Tulasnella sp. 403]|nr:hypothetical protein FRB99_003851 [Tulasnella sp. 403]